MSVVCCVPVPRVMFDTARVLPQQLTSLLMRRALSSSQMALPGTLPCANTHTHTHWYTHTDTYTHMQAGWFMHIHAHSLTLPSKPVVHLTVAFPVTSLNVLQAPSPALPCPPLPSSPPSSTSLFPGSCLSMSQHCRCHKSAAGKTQGRRMGGDGGDFKRGVELVEPPFLTLQPPISWRWMYVCKHNWPDSWRFEISLHHVGVFRHVYLNECVWVCVCLCIQVCP